MNLSMYITTLTLLFSLNSTLFSQATSHNSFCVVILAEDMLFFGNDTTCLKSLPEGVMQVWRLYSWLKRQAINDATKIGKTDSSNG